MVGGPPSHSAIKERWGRGSQYEVHRAASHPTNILTLDPILRRGVASDGKHHRHRQRHPDADAATEDATTPTPSPPNVAAGAQMASVNETPAGASTTTAFDGFQPITPFSLSLCDPEHLFLLPTHPDLMNMTKTKLNKFELDRIYNV